MAVPSQARNNIDAILRLQKEDEKSLAFHHRIFHSIGWFFGTWYFVAAQCFAVWMWIALNGMASQHQAAMDPYPFPLLAMLLSLEAVLLTSCVLIRQNAIDRTSERRNHLELQINLLAEQEATRSLDMLQRIGDHLGVPNAGFASGSVGRGTAIDEIARDLKASEEEKIPGRRKVAKARCRCS